MLKCLDFKRFFLVRLKFHPNRNNEILSHKNGSRPFHGESVYMDYDCVTTDKISAKTIINNCWNRKIHKLVILTLLTSFYAKHKVSSFWTVSFPSLIIKMLFKTLSNFLLKHFSILLWTTSLNLFQSLWFSERKKKSRSFFFQCVLLRTVILLLQLGMYVHT